MAALWLVKTTNGEHGPLESAELKALATSGKITPDTPVRRTTDDKWFVGKQIKGLFGETPSQSQQPPVTKKLPPVKIATAKTRSKSVDGAVRKDGQYLVVPDGYEMPDICVKTGEALNGTGIRIVKRLAWIPPWAYLFFLLAVIAGLIAIFVTRKIGTVTFYISRGAEAERHKWHVRNWLLFAVCILTAVTASTIESIVLGLLSLGLFVATIALYFTRVQLPLPRPKKIADGAIWLRGIEEDVVNRILESRSHLPVNCVPSATAPKAEGIAPQVCKTARASAICACRYARWVLPFCVPFFESRSLWSHRRSAPDDCAVYYGRICCSRNDSGVYCEFAQSCLAMANCGRREALFGRFVGGTFLVICVGSVLGLKLLVMATDRLDQLPVSSQRQTAQAPTSQQRSLRAEITRHYAKHLPICICGR